MELEQLIKAMQENPDNLRDLLAGFQEELKKINEKLREGQAEELRVIRDTTGAIEQWGEDPTQIDIINYLESRLADLQDISPIEVGQTVSDTDFIRNMSEPHSQGAGFGGHVENVSELVKFDEQKDILENHKVLEELYLSGRFTEALDFAQEFYLKQVKVRLINERSKAPLRSNLLLCKKIFCIHNTDPDAGKYVPPHQRMDLKLFSEIQRQHLSTYFKTQVLEDLATKTLELKFSEEKDLQVIHKYLDNLNLEEIREYHISQFGQFDQAHIINNIVKCYNQVVLKLKDIDVKNHEQINKEHILAAFDKALEIRSQFEDKDLPKHLANILFNKAEYLIGIKEYREAYNHYKQDLEQLISYYKPDQQNSHKHLEDIKVARVKMYLCKFWDYKIDGSLKEIELLEDEEKDFYYKRFLEDIAFEIDLKQLGRFHGNEKYSENAECKETLENLEIVVKELEEIKIRLGLSEQSQFDYNSEFSQKLKIEYENFTKYAFWIRFANERVHNKQKLAKLNMVLGSFYETISQYDKALEYYNKTMIHLDDISKESGYDTQFLINKQKAYCYFMLGQCNFSAGNLTEAYQMYKKSLDCHYLFATNYSMGMIYLARGFEDFNPDKAIQYYDNLLKQRNLQPHPKYNFILNGVAKAHFLLRQFSDATEAAFKSRSREKGELEYYEQCLLIIISEQIQFLTGQKEYEQIQHISKFRSEKFFCESGSIINPEKFGEFIRKFNNPNIDLAETEILSHRKEFVNGFLSCFKPSNTAFQEAICFPQDTQRNSDREDILNRRLDSLARVIRTKKGVCASVSLVTYQSEESKLYVAENTPEVSDESKNYIRAFINFIKDRSEDVSGILNRAFEEILLKNMNFLKGADGGNFKKLQNQKIIEDNEMIQGKFLLMNNYYQLFELFRKGDHEALIDYFNHMSNIYGINCTEMNELIEKNLNKQNPKRIWERTILKQINNALKQQTDFESLDQLIVNVYSKLYDELYEVLREHRDEDEFKNLIFRVFRKKIEHNKVIKAVQNGVFNKIIDKESNSEDHVDSEDIFGDLENEDDEISDDELELPYLDSTVAEEPLEAEEDFIGHGESLAGPSHDHNLRSSQIVREGFDPDFYIYFIEGDLGVHCEMKVADAINDHLSEVDSDNIYIGISMLSCINCDVSLQTLQTFHRSGKFPVRLEYCNSHFKHQGWVCPKFIYEDPEFFTEFLVFIYDILTLTKFTPYQILNEHEHQSDWASSVFEVRSQLQDESDSLAGMGSFDAPLPSPYDEEHPSLPLSGDAEVDAEDLMRL